MLYELCILTIFLKLDTLLELNEKITECHIPNSKIETSCGGTSAKLQNSRLCASTHSQISVT